MFKIVVGQDVHPILKSFPDRNVQPGHWQPWLARIEHHPDFQSEHVKDVNPYLGQNFFPSFVKIPFSVYKKTMILSRKRNQDPN